MTSPFAPATEWCGRGAVGWDGTVGPDDLRLLSASSVPKSLASPALERWALTTTIERIAERLPQFTALAAQDVAAAVAWADRLRYAPDEGAALNAAESGTLLHSLLEAWLTGMTPAADLVAQVKVDPVLMAMATELWNFYNRFQPEPVAMERVVYDPEAGIAGRFDAIVRFAKAPQFGTCLMDLKTTRTARYKSGGLKKVYGDSHALQLASYRYAPHVATFEPRILRTKRATSSRVYLLNGAERSACDPMWEVDSTVIVSCSPEKCALHEIDTGPAVRRRALEAVGLHRWLTEESQDVVSDAWVPPIELPELSA